MSQFQRGDWAPAINTLDLRGDVVNFEAYSEWGIWVAFYRYASCPMCNQHFDDVMTQQMRLIENNVLFVAVFESEAKNFPKSLQSREFSNVKLIPNPNQSLYELYGVEKSWLKLFTPQSAIERVRAGMNGYKEETIDGPLNRIPAHFLILPGGIIHQAKYGKSAADHVKWRDLDDFFEAVRGARSQVNRVMPKIDNDDIPVDIATQENTRVVVDDPNDKTIVLKRDD